MVDWQSSAEIENDSGSLAPLTTVDLLDLVGGQRLTEPKCGPLFYRHIQIRGRRPQSPLHANLHM